MFHVETRNTVVVQVPVSAIVSIELIRGMWSVSKPQELDQTAVELVALDGHRMPLKKQERLEAIKLMIANRVSRPNMAWRLCMRVDALERYAQRANIELPLDIPKPHWTLAYVDKRTKEQRRQYRQRASQHRENA